MKTIDHLASRIRALRKDIGLSQVELAERVSVSPDTISRIESGDDTVAIRTIVNIARVLKTTIAELTSVPEKRARLPRCPVVQDHRA